MIMTVQRLGFFKLTVVFLAFFYLLSLFLPLPLHGLSHHTPKEVHFKQQRHPHANKLRFDDNLQAAVRLELDDLDVGINEIVSTFHPREYERFNGGIEGIPEQRTAYLFMVQNQDTIEGAINLIEFLYETKDYFLIHVDLKAHQNSNVSQLIQYLKQKEQENVLVLDRKDSYDVSWGGFSIVKAEIALLKTAISTYRYWKQVVLLCGATIPVKNKYQIDSQLQMYNNLQYNVLGAIECNEERRTSNNVNFSPCLRKMDRTWPTSFSNFYKGANWFTFTRDFVSRGILNSPYYDEVVTYFNKGFFAPDESFFHTLLFNDARFNHTIPDTQRFFPHETDKTYFGGSIMFTSWSPKTVSSPHPYTLEPNGNLKERLRSSDLFARKVEKKDAVTILEEIFSE